jgi:hypothetical protein
MFTDEQVQDMRNFLSDKLEKSGDSRGVNVSRAEIEQWGAKWHMTIYDAACLFEDLKDTVWRGKYHSRGERFPWHGARITEVL